MAEEDELKFLKPEEEYTVVVTVTYPDELWEWCERQGDGNPNGYIFRLIQEDMERKKADSAGTRLETLIEAKVKPKFWVCQASYASHPEGHSRLVA